MVNKYNFLLAILFIVLVNTPVLAANITVISDRTEIQDNESFTVEYSSDSSVDDDPDFTPLEKNFHIVSRSQSSNIQFINGRLDRKSTWVLVLMPKAIGKFTIPAIQFGSDKSNSLSIKVTKATASKSKQDDVVYIEAFVNTESAYIQSQVIYTLRIFHAVRFRNASLSELELSDKDASVEKLEENKKYSKFINGRRYQVFEKRFAIFPQTVGQLVIEPAVLDVQYIEGMRSLRNKRIASEKIKIDIKPIPQVIKNKSLSYWLPSSEVKLEEKWSGDTDNLKIGEPLTRTVTLTAAGLLSSALPDLSVNFPVKGLKHYPDQPSLDNTVTDTGFIGKREEKIAYIPSRPGKVKLPELTLFWWDTNKNTMQKAVLPAREIVVAGGGTQLADDLSNNVTEKLEPGSVPEATESQTDEINLAKDKLVNIGGLSQSIWFWVSLLFLFLWLATTGLWLNARRSTNQDISQSSIVSNESVFSGNAVKDIKSACDSNDPQKAKQALLAWGQKVWQDDPPTSLGHIAKKVNGKFSRELEKLNSVLYKPGATDWDKNALLTALQKFNEEQRKKENNSPSKIKPLFRVTVNQ